jgi:hypothetical protein
MNQTITRDMERTPQSKTGDLERNQSTISVKGKNINK